MYTHRQDKAREAGQRREGGEEWKKGGEQCKGGRNDLIENITSQCRYHFQESNSTEQGAS